jgi:hypothetical protein
MGKIAVDSNRARARAHGVAATLTQAEWAKTLDDFGWLCAYCRTEPAVVLEHFVPVVLTGGTTVGNCLPACRRCNARKHTQHPRAALAPETFARLESYLAARATGQDAGGRPAQATVGRTRNTLLLAADLVEDLRDAVVYLAGPPERLTLAALAEHALRRELDRLRAKHTGGKPFPRRDADLKGGRPIGS